MSTMGSNWQADPVGHPENVPLGDWWQYNLYAVAHCRCGRVAVIQPAELLKRLNHYQGVSAVRLAEFARNVKCIRCHAKEPKITIEVRKP